MNKVKISDTCTYILKELGMVQLVEGIDCTLKGGASRIDSSVELAHRVVDEVRAGKYVILHVVHLLAESFIVV